VAAKDVSRKAPEPDSVRQLEYQVNLACALLRSGQRSQAQEVSQRALEELEKLKGQGFMGWASLEYALRVNLSCALDVVAARKRQLQEATALEPQRVEAKFHLAALLEEEKEPADALKVLMQALQIAPEDVNCLALACRCLEGLGRHTEALATATQLCAVDPASTFLALREVFHCQPEDVFVVTFPRCGTTWMVQIVVSCLFGAGANYGEHAIFLEGSIASSASYVQQIERFPRPRVLKSHVPADMHPGLAHRAESLQEHGKVLYVVRNPKDAMISLRHHHANNAAIGWDGSWDEWVRQWISGERSAEYGGSYFDHVKKWWKLAKLHPDRIRVFYFEEMKANLLEQVKHVAEFLGVALSAERLQEVCAACRFESMRSRHQVTEDIRSRVNPEHFRAGRVGSWRDEITESQARAVDEQLWKQLGKEINEGLRIIDG